MATSNMTQREQRSNYIETWYKTEKSLIRMGGVCLLFATALIAVFDQPGDTYTATAIAMCLAGGITLLGLHRRARQDRTALTFLQEKQQSTRVLFAGGGAVVLITQMGTRPLALIVAGLLLIVALWSQWRVYKIKQFNQLFDDTQARGDITE